jgi:hypothetical protein
MADKIFLCKCIICLKENPNGTQLTLNTYNRHRKRQQFLLEKDENAEIQNIEIQNVTNLNIEEQNKEDILYQEELQTEDIEEVHEYININQEDNEDYSDYDNEEYGNKDNKEDNEENYDDEEDDDNEDDIVDSEEDNDDDDLDEDTMQIDDIPNKKIIDGLKLLHLKSLYNFTESAYNDIMKVFATNNLSLYKIKKYLKEITELVPEFYDMCENSCICYIGLYKSYQNCPICDSARLDTKGKAKKVMPYLSIINRLKMQFNNKNRAKELLYRYEYITNKDDNDDDLDDIFDGKIYKELVDENLFNDKRDVALTASCDGYQIFKQKTDDCWLFLIVNNNLHPSLRVKKENLLIPFLIPGPNQPKDFNTFLRPFINEMKQLESMHFI